MTLNLRLVNPLRHSHNVQILRYYSSFLKPEYERTRKKYPSHPQSSTTNTHSTPFRVKHDEEKIPFKNPTNPITNFLLKPKVQKVYVPPQVVLFHNPSNKLSLRAKKILEQAQTSFPKTSTKIGPPLPLELIVHERLPTVSEIHDIYLGLEEQSWTKFLILNDAYRTHPTNAASILEICQKYREHRVENYKEDETPVNALYQVQKIADADEDDDTAEAFFLNVEPVILPLTHPLFGTECLPWPIILWESNFSQLAPGHKTVTKRLYKYVRQRDGLLSPEEREAAKEYMKEKALQERAEAAMRRRETSPEEEDTLKWFSESSQTRQRNRQRNDE